MARLYANNYTSTIAATITNVATTITVTNSTGLPTITGSDYYYLTLMAGGLNEIVKVTARTSETLTVVRAQESTTGRAWNAGTIISLRPTAETFSGLTVGAVSSTDNAIARFDGTTGKTLQNSVVTVSDTGVIAGIASLTVGTTTIATDDKVLVNDTSASDVTKTVTTQAIRDLAPGAGTITSAQLAASLTNETGSGAAVFATSPTLVTPILGTPTSGDLGNCTNGPPTTYFSLVTRGTSDTGALTASAVTKLQLNTELSDTLGYFDSATNYRFLPTKAGKYLVVGSVKFKTPADGNICIVNIYKDGALYQEAGRLIQGGGGNSTVAFSGVVDLNGSTNYVEIYVVTTGTGVVIDGTTSGTLCYFGLIGQ